jgi:hypothetical protein
MSLLKRLRSAQLKVLNDLNVASPCSADWGQMEGDDKSRYCAECRLHVFDLSAMDLEEAAETIAQHSDGLCVRFFRRHDGTVLTRDCPVGIERKRQTRRVEIRRAVCGVAAGASLALCVRTVWLAPKRTAILGNAQIVDQPLLIEEYRELRGQNPTAVPVQEPAPETEAFLGFLAPPSAAELRELRRFNDIGP